MSELTQAAIKLIALFMFYFTAKNLRKRVEAKEYGRTVEEGCFVLLWLTILNY